MDVVGGDVRDWEYWVGDHGDDCRDYCWAKAL